jgi:16S rRNA (cytosine967-C5)-methyltransferase
MSISPARAASFDILLRIERELAFSSVLLPLYEAQLSSADRSLCHELVLGVLRRQIGLDRLLDVLAPARKLDIEVRIALWLGLYQLLYLTKVPARAAINESVELIKRAKKSSASGFVNAILRRASREEIEVKYADHLDRISVESSHPRWLIQRWGEQLGLDEALRLAESNNQPAKIAFRIIGETDPATDELIASAMASEYVEGCFLQDRSTTLLRKLSVENRVYLQDEASQMVAHGFKVSLGGSFLDVCAAPGGKTGLTASMNHPRIAVAGDMYQSRVELLRGNTRRQGLDVSVVRYDATQGLPFATGYFDAVLVDAPCSGTGTLRHNPEIRYTLRPEDIEELSFKQRQILGEASNAVKQGGVLVYSTCSLEPDEGETVAEAFLNDKREFESEVPTVPQRFVTDAGFARTWPHRDQMDGFFIAVFRRV